MKFIRNKTVNWQIIKRRNKISALLYAKKNNFVEIYGLNKTSLYIWKNIEHKEIIQIIDFFSEQLSKPKDEIINFINHLIKRKLIQIENQNSSTLIPMEKKIPLFEKTDLNLKLEHKIHFANNNDWYSYKLLDLISKEKLYFPFFYPKKIYFDITYRCNLKCKYCYIDKKDQNWYNRALKEEMSLEQIKSTIDDLAVQGIELISLIGGEPFVRKDLPEIIEYIYNKNIEVNINTNGTIINSPILRILKKYKPNLQISLDGPTPKSHDYFRGKGSFSKTVKNTNIFQKNNIPVNLNFVATKRNTILSYKMYKFSKLLNVNNISIIPFTRIGGGKNKIENLNLSFMNYLYIHFLKYILLNSKSTHFHIADCDIYFACHVDNKGNVHLCPHMPRTLPFGNISKTKLIELWRSYNRMTFFDKEKIKSPCKDCVFLEYCSNGCKSEIYSNTNEPLEGNIFCYRGKFFSFFRRLLDW